jgi:hypothetical protein
MKKYLIIFFLIIPGLYSCEKKPNVNDKISISDAEKLIKHWVFYDYHREVNTPVIFHVEEITSDEIWDRLHAQVFSLTLRSEDGNIPGYGLNGRRFFIKNQQVFDLCRNYVWEWPSNKYMVTESGSNGIYFYVGDTLNNQVVADLDSDNIPELYFSLLTGSGKIRSHLICYIHGLYNQYVIADTNFLLRTYKITKFVKEDDQNVYVYQVGFDNVESKIGRVFLEINGSERKLEFTTSY